MKTTFKSKKEIFDPQFSELETAVQHARSRSMVKQNHRYVIQAGDIFFVSEVNNVQHYEKLHAHYYDGVLRNDLK